MLKIVRFAGLGFISAGLVGAFLAILAGIAAGLVFIARELGFVGAVVFLIAVGWALLALAEHFEERRVGKS